MTVHGRGSGGSGATSPAALWASCLSLHLLPGCPVKCTEGPEAMPMGPSQANPWAARMGRTGSAYLLVEPSEGRVAAEKARNRGVLPTRNRLVGCREEGLCTPALAGPDCWSGRSYWAHAPSRGQCVRGQEQMSS